MKKNLLAFLIVSLALPLAACGEKSEDSSVEKTEQIRVMLDYFPNADHAGFYSAQASGEFERAGLDVKLQTPPDPSAPLKLLAAGKTDLAISYPAELLLARDKGLKLVSVGAIVQKPLTSVISLPEAKINGPEDLAGKRVGTAGIPYQSDYLQTILKEAKVDLKSVKETNVGFNLAPAMLTKKVDATLGAFWNYEGVELALKGKKPKIIRMEQAGVPTYPELILVARQEDLPSSGRKVRRLMRALGSGYQLAVNDPDAAAKVLVKANPDLEPKLQSASIKATKSVFFPPNKNHPFGFQTATEWADYGQWMLKNGLVKNNPYAAQAITNEFIPGEGLSGDGL